MRIGIAVGSGSLTVGRSDGQTIRIDLPAFQDGAVAWNEVEQALVAAALALRIPSGPTVRLPNRPSVCIALLPPLVRVRRLMLPRLRDQELQLVLSRDVGRYLIGITEPQVIGFKRVGEGRRSPEPVLLAAAPPWVVDGLARAVESVGWDVAAIGPAHAALAADAEEGRSVLALDLFREELVVETARLVDVRRRPRAPEDGAAASVTLPDAANRAARHAHAVRDFELVPTPIADARAAWSRIWSRRLWVSAAALCLLALGLTRWGMARELAAVRQARVAIRGEVGAAMAAREALETRRAMLQAIAQAERGASRWTGVLGALAGDLPDDAWLTGLRGTADSLALDGSAEQAGGVFEALQRAKDFAGVQATAPIRQISGEDGASMGERFNLVARLRRDAGGANQPTEIPAGDAP